MNWKFWVQNLGMAQSSPSRPPLAKVRQQVGQLLTQSLGRNKSTQVVRITGDPGFDRMTIVETVKSLDLIHTSAYRCSSSFMLSMLVYNWVKSLS